MPRPHARAETAHQNRRKVGPASAAWAAYQDAATHKVNRLSSTTVRPRTMNSSDRQRTNPPSRAWRVEKVRRPQANVGMIDNQAAAAGTSRATQGRTPNAA